MCACHKECSRLVLKDSSMPAASTLYDVITLHRHNVKGAYAHFINNPAGIGAWGEL